MPQPATGSDDISVYLLKSIECVNRAHEILLPKSQEAANQLAKVSNDISDIYTDIYAAGLVPDSGGVKYANAMSAPLYPPGLFSSIEEAQARAKAGTDEDFLEDDKRIRQNQIGFINEQMKIKRACPSAKTFLQPLPGETILDIFNRIVGPWGKSKFEQLLSIDRDSATQLQMSLMDFKEHMMRWNPELLTKNISGYVPAQISSHGRMQDRKATWAKIASLPEGLEGSKARIISSATSPNQQTATKTPLEVTKSDYNEPISRQHRVAFVRGFPEGTRLSAVTAVMQTVSGPIMSILLDKDPVHSFMSACIIFQNAEDTIRFVRSGSSYYGPGISVSLGGTWPEDDEIRSMSTAGNRERRRLTFSASGLFARVTRDRFEAEIVAIAGEANIELIWLFNTGNATVVLSSVRVARVVRNRFLKKASEENVWKGLAVNFSSDPCEKELGLVTQMKNGPEPEAVQRMSEARRVPPK